MRVNPKCGADARVAELLLRDLCRDFEVVEQRRMDVPELMPRQAPEPDFPRRRLQNPRQHLRLPQRIALAIAEDQIPRLTLLSDPPGPLTSLDLRTIAPSGAVAKW